MTIEEIVDGLELYTAGRPLKSQVSITVQELQNFIDAIKAIEQEPCEDAVSRAEVLKGYVEIERADGVEMYSEKAVPTEYIINLPPVTPTRKKGKWIEIKSTEYKEFSVTDMKCNRCNRYASLVLPHGTTCTYDFCPNCEADMRGEEV